jgi:hypothetical protein
MTLSMYQASAPAFQRTLDNFVAILDKLAEHAETHKIDPAVFLGARLFPDMFPFTRQVQIACDFAKGGAGRLAGVELPSFPDTETSIAELKERIAKTQSFLKTLTPAQIDGSEAREITVKVGPEMMTFDGQTYLVHFVLPNFYFHATTAYAILRHNGVALGKRDFMGRR